MNALDALKSTLSDMLGADIGVGASDPRLPSAALWPQETPAVARSVNKRRLEFAAGRATARQAMAANGIPAAPIPQAQNRAPIWPPGLVGSIAHCETACIAAVARSTHLLAIGIDIEPATPLDADLWDPVLTAQEHAWLSRQPPGQRGLLAKLIFCAKECLYKAQFPLSGQLIGFDAVDIIPNSDANTFAVTYNGPNTLGAIPDGRYSIVGDHLLSCLIFQPDRQPLSHTEM